MNASRFMDKQIMDLSNSKSDLNSISNNNFLDLINPQSEEEHAIAGSTDEILPNYDFQPIVPRVSDSLEPKPESSPLRNYSSVEADSEKVVMQKPQKLSDSAIMSEIDCTMKKYTDSLLHAINGLSARLSQIETRTHQIEYSVDDMKVSIGNNHGYADGKMRHMENLLLEVQSSMQDVKDKQEVMDGHLQLAKHQILKAEKSSEPPNAPQSSVSSAPQQSQFLQVPSLSPKVPPPHPSQIPPQDSYFQSPGPTQEAPTQHYQMSLPPQQTLIPPVAPQYPPNPTPSYPQPPPPQQQQQPPPSANASPQFQPPLTYHSEESPYIPQPSYPLNLRAPQTQQYYSSPSPMYEPPQSGRSSSSGYGPPSERYPPYSGPRPSHYGSSIKPQTAPKIPTATILPQAIPTASSISDGPSGGNRVPVDDVIDKVTTMGFPREHVRATVRKLTENGQSVDLNIVLDKLMNEGQVKGWFGR